MQRLVDAVSLRTFGADQPSPPLLGASRLYLAVLRGQCDVGIKSGSASYKVCTLVRLHPYVGGGVHIQQYSGLNSALHLYSWVFVGSYMVPRIEPGSASCKQVPCLLYHYHSSPSLGLLPVLPNTSSFGQLVQMGPGERRES